MALTRTEVLRTALRDRFLHIYKVDFDASYPSGGEPLTTADLGFSDLAADLVVIPIEKSGFSLEYDGANSKLKVLVPAVVTGAAGAGTLDDFPMSGVGATAASVGMTAGNTTTRFGAQKEVADTTDLSTLTGVVLLAFGKKPA
jgi:hypothetical protein